MKRTPLIVVAAGLVLAGCSSTTPAAQTVTSSIPTTVVTTSQKTVVSKVTVTATKTATETETETETSTATPTPAAIRVSEEAACQLLLNGGGGEDGAVSKLAAIITEDLSEPSVEANDATRIAKEMPDIKEDLESLQSRAPEDWGPYLQTHIDVAQQILDFTTSGGSLDIDTGDLRAAGYELISRCD